jgi:hypothetical protein
MAYLLKLGKCQVFDENFLKINCSKNYCTRQRNDNFVTS